MAEGRVGIDGADIMEEDCSTLLGHTAEPAALVVVERSCRCESVELNAMRSVKYGGQRRFLTGSQCRSLRAAVMLDRRSRPSTSRAAAFCAR